MGGLGISQNEALSRKRSGKGNAVDLTFDHCCLTSARASAPTLCRVSGAVYDLAAIVPFLQRHGRDPVTGGPATIAALKRLLVARDEASGAPVCPVTRRQLLGGRGSVVVAVPSGRVFAEEALRGRDVGVCRRVLFGVCCC